jgi:TP901 family phage tail tape measure protein
MAIFKVTAVPDFSQLKGEIAKLQSSPVTLGVDTQQANVNIKTTAKNVATAQEAFQDAGKQAQQSSEKAAEKVRDVGKAAKETSGFAGLMGDSFGRVAAKMALWQVMGNAIAGLKRSFTEALETMKDVDDEMVTIRKVTGATTEELNRIEKQAYDTASAYGVAADEYLNSVANFSRAGYGEQASALAELATKTQIVGDTDAETAQQFLLSMDAAYKYQGRIEQLTKVLDGANEIDNNYATSIEKIAEGLGKVAPIAAQAHVGADELTAAIGTITAVTQRSGTEAATALRALFLNIIGDTKTEIDEGVTWTTGEIAGLRDVIKLYAKDAYDAAQATGSVINPMKAIGGLAQSMKDGLLTEQQLMEMVSDIGGKLRTSQLLALIQNWDMYESMLGDYANAVGSADKEVENALDSWTRKTEILHNKWTEFISNLVETDTIKGALDLVINLVELLDSAGGHLVVTVGLLTGAVLLLGHAKKELMASEAVKDIKAASSAIKELTTKVIAYAAAKKAAAAGDGEMALQAAELKENLVGALGKLKAFGIGAAIFAALGVAISLSTEKARAYEKALAGVETAQSALGETEDEYDTLISKTGELTEAEEKRLEVLRAIREEQEKAVRDAESEAWDAWNELHGTGAEVYVGGGDSVGNGMGVTPVQMVQADVESLAQYKLSLKLVQDQMEAGTKTQEEYYYSLSKLQEGREEEVETIRKAINYGFAVSEEQRQLVAAYDRVQEILGVTQKATQDYVNKLISEAQQAGNTGKALYDLVAAQIAASNTKLNFGQQMSALRELATQAGYSASAIASVFAFDDTSAMNQIRAAATGLMRSGKAKTSEEAMKMAKQNYIDNLWGSLTTFYKPSGGSYGGGSGGYSGGGTSSSSGAKNKYQDEIDALEKQRDAELAAIDAQIDAQKKQNEEIDRAEKLEELRLEVMRKQDALLNARNERTVRMYNAESGQWEWIADPEKVKKAEEDLADAKKDLRDYEREMELDLAIEELEARKKAIEAAYQLKIDALEEYINALGETVEQEKIILEDEVAANEAAAARIAAIRAKMWAANSVGIAAANAAAVGSVPAGSIVGKAGAITGMTAGAIAEAAASKSASKSNGIPSGSTAKDILKGTKKKQTGIPSGTTAKDILSGAGSKSSGKSNRTSVVSGSIIGAVSGGRKRKYDSGGVLHGLGGIKATVDDEMVLPPDVTAKMLKPSADSRFRARVNELGGLYGETPVSRSVAGNSDNRSYSDHSGPTYNVKGITLTEQQAEHLTVAQMCRMAHNVKPYGG